MCGHCPSRRTPTPLPSHLATEASASAFSDFSYTLGCLPVSISPSFVRFSAFNGGGFEICFDGTTVGTCTDALATATFGWPQMYTGMSSALA